MNKPSPSDPFEASIRKLELLSYDDMIQWPGLAQAMKARSRQLAGKDWRSVPPWKVAPTPTLRFSDHVQDMYWTVGSLEDFFA
jgi:hypothetical protein